MKPTGQQSTHVRGSTFRRALFPVLVLVLGMIAYSGVSYLFSVRAAALVEEGVQYREKEIREQYLLRVDRALSTTREEQERLLQHFVDEKTVAGFLENVETVGRRLGLTVDTSSLGVLKGVLTVQSKVAGPYPAIVQFISLIETMPYRLLVNNARLNYSNGSWSGIISLSVESFIENP